MHIYTMGTRSYAEAVVKEIDPTGELFQDRILSRDENGSMTRKRLERLFPSDTSKVVVLDDRADVWDYSPNLIQIKPYEYFIGIGDINSPFAQPKKDIIPSAETLAKPINILNEVEEKFTNQVQSEVNDNNNNVSEANDNNNKVSEANNSNKESEANDSNGKSEVNDSNKEPEANGSTKEPEANSNTTEPEADNSNKQPEVTTENPVDKDIEANTNNQKPNEKEESSDEKDKESTTLSNNTTTTSDDSSENEEQDIYSDTEDDEETDVKSTTSKSKDDHIFKVPAPVQKPETHLPNTHDADDILRVTRRVRYIVFFSYIGDNSI